MTMDLVIVGQQDWDVTWTEKQQFATRLAARGHRVLYVNPDGEPGSSALRCIATGSLWVLTPPDTFAPLLEDDQRIARIVTKTVRRLGFREPAVLTFTPLSAPWLQHFSYAGLVYFAVDEWMGFFTGDAADAVRVQEERLLRAADVVVGISPRLVERFQESDAHVVRIANGVDAARFAPSALAPTETQDAAHHRSPTLVEGIASPRIGLVGQIDARVDAALLEAIVSAHPEWQLVLAGRVVPSERLNALLARGNVHHVGFVTHDALPALLQQFAVCLIPYHLTPHTHSCNPAKAYEYLASGVPIVSTPLDGLDQLRSAIRFAESEVEFIAAVEQALAEPVDARAGRLSLARTFGWEERTDQVEACLREAVIRRSERAALLRGRLGAAAVGVRGARRAPLLDRKDESDQRAHGFFADARLSPRATLALRIVQRAGRGYWLARVALRTLARQRYRRVRRILIARRAYLGDLVVLLPMLQAVRERFPGATITLGVQRDFSARGVLEQTGLVHEVLEMEYFDHTGSRRLLTAAAMFARGFDLVIHGVSYFLQREAFFTGAPYHAGIDDGHPWQAALDVSVPLQPNRHEAENNLAITDALGQPAPFAERAPSLAPPASTGVRDLLRRLDVPTDVRVLVMHVGSKRPSRRWPHDRFARLATSLLSQDERCWIILTGVRSEIDLVESVRQLVPAHVAGRLVNAAGLCSLHELRVLLTAAESVICNDTGVMHLARAQGTPLLALLGPENDRRWGPHAWGKAPAMALRHKVPCAPCLRNECEYLWCLRSLDVPEAHEAYLQLTDAAAPNGPMSEARGVAVAPASTQPLVALTRRMHRHTFADLAAAGFDLPKVTVVLMPAEDETVRAHARDALCRQDYPVVQLMTVDDDGGWTAVLDATNGTFVAVVHAREVAAWPPGKLSADVAALVRMPQAGRTPPRIARSPDEQGDAPANGRLPGRLVRHAAFAAAVATMIAQSDAVRVAEVA